ncbi:MAG TPA: saccharopine dehydrogenase NADP-binding domain-containing protein [Kribbella sp.]|nr:saccharopine dehydrogenase NADP-binding domain-containing protein [Kribbella sp.]
MSRAYDIVLLGASGFTGALTAEYLEKNAPEGLRRAVAGRNKAKLERFGRDIVYADATDPESLRKLAGSTKVVATTVGPYIQYGEGLVAACAEAGTGYLDLTGEPEFADRMYVRYHERATRTGARIIHACGFDSIPYDLGV